MHFLEAFKLNWDTGYWILHLFGKNFVSIKKWMDTLFKVLAIGRLLSILLKLFRVEEILVLDMDYKATKISSRCFLNAFQVASKHEMSTIIMKNDEFMASCIFWLLFTGCSLQTNHLYSVQFIRDCLTRFWQLIMHPSGFIKYRALPWFGYPALGDIPG